MNGSGEVWSLRSWTHEGGLSSELRTSLYDIISFLIKEVSLNHFKVEVNGISRAFRNSVSILPLEINVAAVTLFKILLFLLNVICLLIITRVPYSLSNGKSLILKYKYNLI